MHENTAVPALVEEIYMFLKQADTRELTHIFKELEVAKATKNQAKIDEVIAKIDNFETHAVPIFFSVLTQFILFFYSRCMKKLPFPLWLRKFTCF